MNIVTAIRNLPEPPDSKPRKRRILAAVALAAGPSCGVMGVREKDEITLGLGVSMIILSLVPIARGLGVPDRLARTAGGVGLVAWFVLPMGQWLLGDLKTNFSIFILAGIMIVVGATWAIMYNADILLGALSLRWAHPEPGADAEDGGCLSAAKHLPHGVALAMFTLVVFTLVVGAITTGSFQNGFNDLDEFGGGFHIRASASPVSPITDMSGLLGRAGFDPEAFTVISSQSFLPVEAPDGLAFCELCGPWARFGLPREHDVSPGCTSRRIRIGRRSVESPRPAAGSCDRRPDDGAPAGELVGFAPPQEFRLHGFLPRGRDLTPIPVEVVILKPVSLRLTIVGILSDTAPYSMAGISTSQATVAGAFGDRVEPTVHLFALRDPTQARATAQALEEGFLANGMEADAIEKLLETRSQRTRPSRDSYRDSWVSASSSGSLRCVITARSVVERRQQIGVLRAIGFRRRMVQVSFLLESSFIALTSILVGTGLGLAVAYNVILNSRQQPSWENMSFDVPWLNLGVIFLAVYLTALVTTLAPALRASRSPGRGFAISMTRRKSANTPRED